MGFFRIKFTIFLYNFLVRVVVQFYRKICLFFFLEFLVIRMFVKNSICALQILEKAIARLGVTHIAQISTDCLIRGNLLRKKTFAKEKYIIQLNSVLFINITKDLQYYILLRYA